MVEQIDNDVLSHLRKELFIGSKMVFLILENAVLKRCVLCKCAKT